MQLLKARGLTLHLLLGAGGPLLDEYRQTADSVTLWPDADNGVLGPLGDKVLGKLGLYASLAKKTEDQRRADLSQQLKVDTIDLVLVNTVSGSHWFGLLDLPPSVPVITFVHEQAIAVAMYAQPDELAHLLQRSQHVLAVSEATASYYREQHSVDPAKLSIFTLIDLPAVRNRMEQARLLANPMPDLGLPAGAVIVGGCGNAEWRKGPDLFVALARLVKSQLPNEVIYFVWVGMPAGSLQADLQLDITKAGLADRVRLVAPTPDVLRYVSRFSIFVLCSREDPYPLVVIEAGLAGVPVVCFDQAGGAGELVETDGGFVVPYLDLGAMSDRISQLATDSALCRLLGQRLTEKINERHDPTQSLSLFLNLIAHLTHA